MKTRFSNYLLVALVVALSGLAIMGQLYRKSRAENRRQAQNVENLVKTHDQELQLKRSEFEKAETWWKHSLDSVIEQADLKLKNVQSATIIRTEYKDTGSVKIVYKEPQRVNEFTYMVPVSYRDSCWGMEGYMLSSDSTSTFELTERTAMNKAHLLVVRKQFLGFLWWTRKTRFEAYTDCGKIDFVKIEFKK